MSLYTLKTFHQSHCIMSLYEGEIQTIVNHVGQTVKTNLHLRISNLQQWSKM